MFGRLETLPPDPILGVTAAFRRDPDPNKVDVGVGVYRDEGGNTPVMAAVRTAERAMLGEQATKTYVGPAGNLAFNERVVELALGPLAAELAQRTATIQTVGGCGALRLGAELIRVGAPGSIVHVSDPTWANHEPLLGTIGLALERYPYYDPATRGVGNERMLEHLDRLPAASVVLLHGSCHNPTGADLQPEQWSAVTEVVVRRGLIPFVDMAYQGLGDDLDTDAGGLRRLARRVPQFLLAISCSKNFGVYRERTGALAVVTESASAAAAVATHQARTARRMYSMPPDHGAAVAAHVLGDATLRTAWEHELREMVARMKSLRTLLAGRLAARRADIDFSWLTRHRGMFSLLGLDAVAIARLREQYHVYLPPDGRINVAGVNEANVDRVADGIASVLGGA
jgi:aspartate/tyrosine/aromatic aminotransferase